MEGWMHVCMYVCMDVCMYRRVYVYMYECIRVCMYVYMYASMYVCMYMSCVSACMYVCMYGCLPVRLNVFMVTCVSAIYRCVDTLCCLMNAKGLPLPPHVITFMSNTCVRAGRGNRVACWGSQAGLKPGGVFILKENQAREGGQHTRVFITIRIDGIVIVRV